MDEIQSKIEAILFASGEPVEIKKIVAFFKVKQGKIEEEIKKLSEFYENEKRGLQITRKRNTIQLVSAASHGEFVACFLNKKIHESLTKTALEVLAIVAYRGPVTRAQIEHIRGVNCSFSLRNLAIRGIVDRKENLADGRAYIYEISHEFLKNCGLSSIEELPEYELLNVHKIPQMLHFEKKQVKIINKSS